MFAYFKNRFRFFSSFALVFVVSLAFAERAFADPPVQNEGVVTVSYTPTPDRLILLPVQIANAKGQTVDATFLLDSGAGTSAISQDIATKLGFMTKPAVGSDGKPILVQNKQQQMTDVSMVKIGTLSIADSPFVVLDDSLLNTNMVPHIDGIIGANFLRDVPTVIDFAKKQVTFLAFQSLAPLELHMAGMDGSMIIPLTTGVPDEYHYKCRIQLENLGHVAQTNLLVDTGATDCTLSQQTAKQLAMTPMMKTQTLTAIAGTMPLNLGGLETLHFVGGPSIHGLIVSYYLQDKSNDILMSHIGVDVLSRYRVLLDFPDHRMYLQPYPPVTVPLLSDTNKPPLVTVSLDGKTTGTFLVNTSDDISSLTTTLAAKLAVTPQPAFGTDGKPILVGGKQVPGLTLTQASLSSQPLSNATFLVLDPSTYAPLGFPVVGILGMSVLESQACLLDMAAHKITLWGDNAFTAADLKELDMTDAVAVPLNEISGTGQFSVTAHLKNGKKSTDEELEIDTSKAPNYISEKSITKLGLADAGDPLQISANGTTYTISHTTVPEVSLGPLILKDCYASYAVGSEPPGVAHHLGLAFFSQYRVLFDFAHKIMYIKPNLPAASAVVTSPASAPVDDSH